MEERRNFVEKIHLSEVKKKMIDPDLHSAPETILNSSFPKYLIF